MRHLSKKLQEFIDDAKVIRKDELDSHSEKLFRSLKTQGERAIKGRLISKCTFESSQRHGISLLMKMEGRHSMSVGKQVGKRFEESEDVDSFEVVKTNTGAYLILRVRENIDEQTD